MSGYMIDAYLYYRENGCDKKKAIELARQDLLLQEMFPDA